MNSEEANAAAKGAFHGLQLALTQDWQDEVIKFLAKCQQNNQEAKMCAVFGGKFYSSKNAKSGDVVTFKDAGDWVESSFKKPDGTPQKQFQIGITFGGNDYTMGVNGTNINNLIPAYGRDSSAWVGKQAKVEIVKAMVAGKMRDMIILQPIEISVDDASHEDEWPQEG